jgi:DinB superfamily
MPVPTEIAHAARGFQMNAQLFEKSLEGLTSEEWCCCPSKSPNGLIWVAGHIVWSRSRALAFLGTQWSKPWLNQFERGAKPGEADQYPATEEIVAAWHEVKATLNAALENVSEEALAAPGPERVPSFDGKVSGLLGFFAWHESYHVGQMAYIRRCLGHTQVAG